MTPAAADPPSRLAPRLTLAGVRLARADFTLEVDALSIEPGAVVGVVGGNGSGKTTLVEVLALLRPPDAGVVSIGGAAVSTTGAAALGWRRRMGAAFREPHLLARSVLDNVALPLRLRGTSRPDADRAATAWLERLDAGALARRDPGTLSSGEAQRVSVARALAPDPEVVFLDEAFGALDPADRHPLQDAVVSHARDRGVTLVLVSHDRDTALALTDRVVLLDRGRAVESGPAAELLAAPRSLAGARWAGFSNLIPVDATTTGEGGLASVRLAPGVELASAAPPPDGPTVAAIRPEAITLFAAADGPDGADPPAVGSARNLLSGRVSRVETSGVRSRVRVEIGAGAAVVLDAVVTTASAEAMALAPDAAVRVGIKATAVHLVAAPPAPSGNPGASLPPRPAMS